LRDWRRHLTTSHNLMKEKPNINTEQNKAQEPYLLTPEQAADFLQVTVRTIRNLSQRGIIPRTKLTGRIVRYRRPDLEKALSLLTTGAR